ncbi:hypothetical protein [Paraburkholderia elongata]|uniref:Uncharacterized protein n=1 Tax=Paraburkholderia elongata TaxID=2675747 RepID=A0A972SKW5_9BURK|nr:hypothetical protein [Paraburkholderia elongata]NPT55020.1 hypothetical protein [Paraburkholderia elongata]
MTLKSVVQPNREEGANDQLEVDGQKIVTPRIEDDTVRDQLWIWYQVERICCQGGAGHLNEAGGGQRREGNQHSDHCGLRAVNERIVTKTDPQYETAVYPPGGEQCKLQALCSARDQRYHNLCVVRFEAIERSREAGRNRMPDEQGS